MIERRARPEHAQFLLDALPCDAVIVSDAAARCHSQLFVHVARRTELEIFAAAQFSGQIADDQRVGLRIAGRIDGLIDLLNAAFRAEQTMPSSSSCRLPAKTTSA